MKVLQQAFSKIQRSPEPTETPFLSFESRSELHRLRMEGVPDLHPEIEELIGVILHALTRRNLQAIVLLPSDDLNAVRAALELSQSRENQRGAMII